MSLKIKLCSGLEAVKKLKKAGWIIDRPKGSHIMMVKNDYPYTLSVPKHRQLGVGILRKIIKQANLSGPIHKYDGIRLPVHLAPLRCLSVKYCVEYLPSARLAGRAPRLPRYFTVFMNRTTYRKGI